MKTRGVIGKRIVRVIQGKEDAGGTRGLTNSVAALVLEDGTELQPLTRETEHGEYWHDFVVIPGKKRP